jgi:hypothetical protein
VGRQARHDARAGGELQRRDFAADGRGDTVISDHNPRFLNVPVDVQIQWPRKQATIAFGAWEIIAFPPSEDHDPSLHIELTRMRLSTVEAGSVLNQLLSVAAWLDDTSAVLLHGWAGNPVPLQTSSADNGMAEKHCRHLVQCLAAGQGRESSARTRDLS